MAEYIEREAIQKRLNRIVEVNNLRTDLAWFTPYGVNALIEEIPAADVRPVVLCLHCKNWDTSWAPNCGKEYGHFCPMVGNVTRADWFCAYGEKREES